MDRRISAMAVGAILCGLIVTACSSSPETAQSTDYLSDEWALALKTATSDFERRALEDGVVSRAEYDEAHQLWLECMQQEFPPGGPVQVSIRIREQDGLYEYVLSSTSTEDQERFDLWKDSCSIGTTIHVAFLYNSETSNPEGLPFAALVFQCLDESGLVPEGYTVDEFMQDFEAYANGSDRDVPFPNDGRHVLDCAAKV